jgi:cobyrinic acid a,c-diamide synthase
MAETVNGFVVGRTASGVGKTTVTLALLAALRKRGHTVLQLHFLSNAGLATRFVEHTRRSKQADRGAQSQC